MDIERYSGYFHDGGILNIKQQDKNIEISMESSQLINEELFEDVNLSDIRSIRGILHIEDIISIYKNDIWVDLLKMSFDSGEILQFDISDSIVSLLIEWINYPPKQRFKTIELIEIEAKKIYWENIPDLYDPMMEGYIDNRKIVSDHQDEIDKDEDIT